jgi:hypothetical protein
MDKIEGRQEVQYASRIEQQAQKKANINET